MSGPALKIKFDEMAAASTSCLLRTPDEVDAKLACLQQTTDSLRRIHTDLIVLKNDQAPLSRSEIAYFMGILSGLPDPKNAYEEAITSDARLGEYSSAWDNVFDDLHTYPSFESE